MESEHSGDADSRSQHSSSPSAISSHRSTPRSFSSPPPANYSSSPPPAPHSTSSIFPGFSGLNKCTPGGYPTLPHSMYPMLPFSLPSPFSLPMPLPFSAFVSASGKGTITTESVSSAVCTTASSSRTLDNSTEVSAISSVTPSERGAEMSKAKNAIPGLNCVVCGDTSSGKHYGILACNGCSGFFKRSVRRRLLYRCQTGTGNCVIDKAHRNQCQACRLKKCLQFGMNRDAVQNERQPRNSATLRPEVLAEMDQERFLREAVTAVGAFGPPVSLAMSLVSSAVQLQHNKAEEQREREAAHLTAVKMEVPETERKPNSPQNASSQHLVNLSSAPFLYADPNNYNNATAVSSENVYETSARLLFMAVKWAKNLPSFAGLPFRDQVILLEESWAEIFLLCTLQWSMHLDSAPLFMASSHSALPNNNNNSPTHGQSRNGSKCASPTSLSNNNLVSDLRFLNDLSQRFKNLSVDAAEFACMKAIVLFRQVRGLKDPAQVESLQDQAQVMLSQHCRLQWPHQPARFGKLLLLLPLLRHVPSLRMEHLYFRQTIGTTPMEKVLADMYRH